MPAQGENRYHAIRHPELVEGSGQLLAEEEDRMILQQAQE
jgi:hypothetical protein